MKKNIYIILNILKGIINKKKQGAIFEKIYNKFFEKKGSISYEENLNWIKSNCSNFNDYALNIDKDLWFKSSKKVKELKEKSNKILSNIEVNLGGGGIYPLLYFLTKKYKPKVVFETGVAAGHSSNTFLVAMHQNKKGKLYSSELPYFRWKNPEKYIGILVEDKYKYRWELFLKGDSENIKEIKEKVKRIDFFHYDSDKTYNGIQKTFKSIINLFNKNTIILVDDIQDNCFFYDLVKEQVNSKWYIFEFEGKYCGLLFFDN